MAFGLQGPGFRNPEEIIANIVIVEGTSGGIFLYNGTGGPGNPPILSAVAPGTTTDPFGNAVGAVLNIGLLAGAHVNFDASGDISVINSTGLTVIYISPTNQFIGFYPTGKGVGPPLITIAAANGNDGSGNTFLEGFEVHGNSGAYNLLSFFGNQPIDQFATGVSEELSPANITAAIIDAGLGNQTLQLIATSAVEVGGSGALWILQSTAKDVSTPATGYLLYKASGGALVTLLQWSTDGIHVFIPRSGDTIEYQTEELRLICTGQTIATTVQTPISGFTTSPGNVGIGNYIIDVFLTYSGSVAAGNPVFVLNGPAGTSAAANRFFTNGAPAAVNTGIVNIGAAMNGPTYQVGAVQQIHITGQFNFTAAGVVSMTAATSVAADHLLIGGGYMTIRPIGTT
jgi:hypothetical protein